MSQLKAIATFEREKLGDFRPHALEPFKLLIAEEHMPRTPTDSDEYRSIAGSRLGLAGMLVELPA